MTRQFYEAHFMLSSVRLSTKFITLVSFFLILQSDMVITAEFAVSEPLSGRPLMSKGIDLMRRGHFEEAFECFETILKNDSNNALGIRNLAQCMFAFENYDEAQAMIDRALGIKPDMAKAWYTQGLCYAAVGEHTKAVSSLSAAVSCDPGYIDAIYALGVSQESLSHYEKAVLCYDEVLTHRNKHFMRAWYRKITCLKELNRIKEVDEMVYKANRFDRRRGYIYYNNSVIYFDEENYTEAIFQLSLALEIDPMNENAWNNKGTCHSRIGHYRDAIFCFRKVIEFKPDHISALNNLASCLSRTGSHAKAIEFCNRSIELRPGYSLPWRIKANALGLLGRSDEAVVCYNTYLENNPDDHAVMRNKSVALIKSGRYYEALTVIDNALLLKPGDTTLLDVKDLCQSHIERAAQKKYKPRLKTK